MGSTPKRQISAHINEKRDAHVKIPPLTKAVYRKQSDRKVEKACWKVLTPFSKENIRGPKSQNDESVGKKHKLVATVTISGGYWCIT